MRQTASPTKDKAHWSDILRDAQLLSGTRASEQGRTAWTDSVTSSLNTLACAAFGIAASNCDPPAIPGIQGKGNVHERVLVGPYGGYNFGPVEINAKILYTVQAENAFKSSFYHIGFSLPF
jgi:hypothetical protein